MRDEAIPISAERFDQAESPRWDPRGERLIWVDLKRSKLYVAPFDGSTLGVTSSYEFAGGIGCAAPIQDAEGWVVASDREFWVQNESGERAVVATGVGDPGEFLNDGVADSTGRFWAGTQRVPRSAESHLYSLETDGRVVERLNRVTVSNGISFSPDARTMYYIDTLPHRSIEAFNVAADGELSGRRTIAKIDHGNPDGMTIDLDGNLWVALWDAGEVRHYDPDGRLLKTIELPASRPTAVTLFRSTLVITTARTGLPRPGKFDGAIFTLPVAVEGAPTPPWRGHALAGIE